MFEVNAGQNKQRTRESVPLLMRIRAQGILSGVLLSTMLGAAWYGRAASVRSLPSTWKTPRTPFKPCDAGRRSDRRTGGSAASAPTGTTALRTSGLGLVP